MARRDGEKATAKSLARELRTNMERVGEEGVLLLADHQSVERLCKGPTGHGALQRSMKCQSGKTLVDGRSYTIGVFASDFESAAPLDIARGPWPSWLTLGREPYNLLRSESC